MLLEDFSAVTASMKKNPSRSFHLLMGNGFSIAFDHKIFSYNALYEFVSKIDDKDLASILGAIEIKNFETIMQHLDSCTRIISAVNGDAALCNRIQAVSGKLKDGLLQAVKDLHPAHTFEVSDEQHECCAKFLSAFLRTGGAIYSTNYDLLLYWVLMRSGISEHVDGCGRDLENPEEVAKGEDEQWSELIWGKHRDKQNTFYLHGALQFFDARRRIVKEVYDKTNYLLEKISDRMARGEYPIFVTAGDGDQKLDQIMHNQYLAYCYERLCEITGSLVTFGFNFGDSDGHIIEAINTAANQGRKAANRLWSVYIGVYSEADKKRIESLAEKIKCKVHIFDAKTAPVWSAAV
jgi:hypothetical protein